MHWLLASERGGSASPGDAERRLPLVRLLVPVVAGSKARGDERVERGIADIYNTVEHEKSI